MTSLAVLQAAIDVKKRLGLLSPEVRDEVLSLVMEDDEEPFIPREASPTPSDGAKPAAPAKTGRADLVAKGEERGAELLALVKGAGGRAEVSWLAEKMAISDVSVRKYAARLIERGDLARASRGLVEVPGMPVKRPTGTSKMTVLEKPLAQIIEYLTRKGPQTRRDIAARFGATLVTVQARVDELVRQGRARVEGDLVHAVKEAANG